MPPKKSPASPKPRLYATPILASLTQGKKRGPPPPSSAKGPTKKELADAKRLKKAQEIIEKENLKAGVSFVAGTSKPIPVDPSEKFVKPKPMKGKLPKAKAPSPPSQDEIDKAVNEAIATTEETMSASDLSDVEEEEEEDSSGPEPEEEKPILKKTTSAITTTTTNTNGHTDQAPKTPATTEEKKKKTPKAPKKPATKKEEFPPWLPTFFSTVLKEAYQSTDQKVSKKKIQEQAKEESSRAWADPVRKERAQAVADDHVNKMYKSIFG